MLSVIRATWVLFLGLGFIMLANGLLASLLGLRATLEGFPTAAIGLIMTGFYVGFLAGSLLGPRLVREVGHVRVFAALASLGAATVLGQAVFVEPLSWGALRFVTGFCYAGLYVVAESWLNDRASNATRGRILSIYMVVTLGGMGFGQFLLNLADAQGFELFALASVLVSLAVVPMLLTASPAPDFAAPQPMGLRRLLAVSPLGVVGLFGTAVAQGGLYGMGAVYASASGFSVAEVSLFMATATFGGVALQWPIGRLSDALDRRLVLTAVTILAALAAYGAIPIGANEGASWMFFAVAALFGGLCLPMYSLCIAHTNDFLVPRQMVAASGSLVLVGGAGAVLGPVTVSAVMAAFGPAGFFATLGTAHAVIGLFALYRMTVRPATPLAQQGPFVPIPPRTSPVCATLAVDSGIDPVAEPADAPVPAPAAAKAVDRPAQNR